MDVIFQRQLLLYKSINLIRILTLTLNFTLKNKRNQTKVKKDKVKQKEKMKMINSQSVALNNKNKISVQQNQDIYVKLIQIQTLNIIIAKMQNRSDEDKFEQFQIKQISQQDNIKQNEIMSPVNCGQIQSKLQEATTILQSLNGGVVSKNNEQFSKILKAHNVDKQVNQFSSINCEQQQIQQMLNMNSSSQNQQNYYEQGVFVKVKQDNQKNIVIRNINEIQQKEYIQNQNAYQKVQSAQYKQSFDKNQTLQVRQNSNQFTYGKSSNGLSSSEQKYRFNLTGRFRQSLSPQKIQRNIQNINPQIKEEGPLSSNMKKVSTKPLYNQLQDEYNCQTNLENTNEVRSINDLTKEYDYFKSTKRHQSVFYQSNGNGQEQQYGQNKGFYNEKNLSSEFLQQLQSVNSKFEQMKRSRQDVSQLQDIYSQNFTNQYKYGQHKQISNDQYDDLIESNGNQGQKIALLAKKIEQQKIESVHSTFSGIHNYRVQTAQSNNKQGRLISQAYQYNLNKGSPYSDFNSTQPNFISTQSYYPINENGKIQTSQNIFTNQQQKQMLINSIGRTYSQNRHPLSANTKNKPFLLQQQQYEMGNIDLFKNIKHQSSEFSNKVELKSVLNKQNDNINQKMDSSDMESSSGNEIADSQIKNFQNLNLSEIQKNQFQKFAQNQQNQEISTSQIVQKYYMPLQHKNGQGNQFIDQNNLILELNNNIKPGQQNIQSFYQKNNGSQVSPISNSSTEQFYKYIINYGNNCTVVKRVMETRENWKAIESHNTAYNFRWCPVSQGVKFERIGVGMKQLVNHLEFHKELTCKFTLVKNMKSYCEQNKINLFNVTPLTFLIDLDDELCDYQLRKFGKFFFKNMPKNSSVVKKPENIKKVINEFCKRLKPLMQYPMCDRKEKQNTFSKSKMHESFANGDNYFWFLKPTGTNRGRGIYIFNTLEQLEKYIQDYFVGMEEQLLCNRKKSQISQEQNQLSLKIDTQISPRTQNPNLQEQLQHQFDQNKQQKISDENQLIQSKKSQIFEQVSSNLKPIDYDSADRNRSSIQNQQYLNSGVSEKPHDQFKKRRSTVNSINQNKDPVSIIKCRQFVVQKYVERPMLINGRKFDVRAWVLVTHTMDVYFFKESVIRTSCEKFNLDNNQINNQFVHLTNNAVQRYADNYGEFESGNQMSLANFFRYCKIKHPNECDTDKIHKDMKNIVYHTMNSVKRKINPEDRKFTFEIYGYDFLLDEKFNVWLLEINTNPCLDESSPHLEQAIPRLLDDAFKMTLDILYPKTKIIQKAPQINKSNSSVITQNTMKNQNMINVSNNQNTQGYRDSYLKTETIELKGQNKNNLNDQINFDEQQENNVSFNSPIIKSILVDAKSENAEINSPSLSTQQESQTPQAQLGQSINTGSTQASIRSPIIQRLNSKKETNWPVDGHPNDENMWEFLLNIYCPKPKSAVTQKKSTF